MASKRAASRLAHRTGLLRLWDRSSFFRPRSHLCLVGGRPGPSPSASQGAAGHVGRAADGGTAGAGGRGSPVSRGPLLDHAFGTVGPSRYAHLRRTDVLRITESTVYAFCGKGKQRRNRSGFYFCIPAWRRAFEALPPAQGQCGLCFDSNGFSWSLRESTLAVQAVFAESSDNAAELTSYSWRRILPSLGTVC